MFEGDGDQAATASAILSAVKAGELAGIYQQDQRAPALRAQGMGKGWWQLFDGVPPERPALCWKEPASAPPMIVLRRGMKFGVQVLDASLREAWEQCGLRAAAPRPHSDPPPPAQQTPAEWEGRFDWDAQFAAHYDNCWREHPLAADECRSFRELSGSNDALAVAHLLGTYCNQPPPMPREAMAQVRTCCTAALRARDAVDACVTTRVTASAQAASGGSPTARQSVQRRYADWKRRNAKP